MMYMEWTSARQCYLELHKVTLDQEMQYCSKIISKMQVLIFNTLVRALG